MANAWMIRNDGKSFEVTVHPYGNNDVEFVEETIAAGEWLYNHTKNENSKRLVINLICTFIDDYELVGNRIEKLTSLVNKRPYKWLTQDFINTHEKEILDFNTTGTLQDLNDLVNVELNQEFLRARYGGDYNSSKSSREMYFRISSHDFDWFNIIYEFVYNMRNRIDTVNIIRDDPNEEYEDTLYFKHRGELFKNMPIDDFITISGTPVVESYGSTVDMRSLIDKNSRKNYARIINSWNLNKYKYTNSNFEF